MSKDTRTLKWCEKHKEPVWVYATGDWSCVWMLVVETSDDTQCVVVNTIPESVLFKPEEV